MEKSFLEGGRDRIINLLTPATRKQIGSSIFSQLLANKSASERQFFRHVRREIRHVWRAGTQRRRLPRTVEYADGGGGGRLTVVARWGVSRPGLAHVVLLVVFTRGGHGRARVLLV